MSDLDEKLKEIVESNTHVGLDADGLSILVARDVSMIAQIKQAFADEGNLKVNLRVKIRLWTPKGYDDYDQTWTPQVLVPRNKLHKALDARDRSFVEVELLNEGADLMTGQEWYDRLLHELDLGGIVATRHIDAAAKRAAGLETNDA